MKGLVPERVGLDESLLVPNNVGTLHGGQDADLVECVLLLLLGEVGHLDFLERVDLGVGHALHLVD
jgi:hypothetical protein